MKFHFFHLMPYRDLPDDFDKRYESVWLNLPADLLDSTKIHSLYHEYLDQLEAAEESGFDGIAVNEHHSNAYGLMPSPNLMAATLARRTSRAAIILLGNSLALYNPPVRVAEELAMLDVLSGGRVVAGFPVGTSMDANFAYGIPPATLRERYREAHDLILRAWQSPGPFSFNGKYTQLRYVNPFPRPLQKPHPPIWIPGAGSLETWEWVCKQNYFYAFLSYFGYKPAEKALSGFWETVERNGLPLNPYRAGYLQLVAVAETDGKAEEYYGKHAEYFYHKLLHVPLPFLAAPGYMSAPSIRAMAYSMDLNRLKALRWKDFVKDGYVIAGSPATVRDRLQEVLKNLRVGHLLMLLHFGSMPNDLTLKNMRLFAEEVMPALRGLWNEWQDDWWPRSAQLPAI